jgi:pimeloyl-ACP methyl ester carboxylesterase
MFPIAVPDYVRFGPINGVRLFHEMTRYPSLQRLVHTPVPILAVLGVHDPLLPSPDRVREVAARAPEQLAVAVLDKAAHAVNFSHATELAGTVEAWLDDPYLEHARLPDGVRLFPPPGRADRP